MLAMLVFKLTGVVGTTLSQEKEQHQEQKDLVV